MRCFMKNTYQKLLSNLNVVKWELKGRNDPTLNLCIKCIQDAIFDAGRLNMELVTLKAANNSKDDVDDWSGD